MSRLTTYCKGCDQFSAPHRRRDDGQWVCEDCGHLVECPDPQWSDNCDGELTTPHEVKKGLCEGCMAVIDSWSDDGGGDGGAEQTKLITDGGRDNVEKMNEYREVREYVRQLRENALNLDDLVDEMQWVAAGGRGTFDPEKFDRLVEANLRMCEDLEEIDIPNPYEVRNES